MNGELVERIRQAVSDGVEARSMYYVAIGLADEQRLGPPADPSLIVELERSLGLPLPPSYRTFLTLYDGWHMIDGAMDLLPVRDILTGAPKAKIQQWQEKEREAGDSVAANSLVIAASDVVPTKLLLDPDDVAPDGEWRMVQHHKTEEYDYPSFLAWLEESVDDFRDLAREERKENRDSGG